MSHHDGPDHEMPDASAASGPDEDELVSAVLDGVATDDERARVESDPRLVARLESFRAVRAVLGTPAPVRAGDATVEPAAASTERAVSTAPVPRPARRRGRTPWVWAGAAAAALILVVAGLGVAGTTGGGGDESASTAADSAEAPSTTATAGVDESARSDAAESEGATTESGAAPLAPTTTAPLAATDGSTGLAEETLPDLGDLATRADLVSAVGALPPGTSVGAPCEVAFAAEGAVPEVTARVAGTPVVAGRGPSGVLVLDLATCRPLS